ncbi:MAG: hypothetical protein INH41_27155 [Myxococcaceae bacterium]|nr:hypothetical protein [Myxococcaceae bacterium]MCA3016079.1 hypothetical protein [Myxococcaceae bacterium]
MNVVLLPGFNGAARQPVLARLGAALSPGHRCEYPGLPRGRPSEGLTREVRFLEAAIAGLALDGPPVLVGRSFGGRVALRYALEQPVRALVLLGFPLRPPDRPRPDDEAALRRVEVPTLVVQGDADEKGPLALLEPIVRRNRQLTLVVLPKTGHRFGRHERTAVEAAVDFLSGLGPPVSRARRRV